jgi:hypothetical protein
MSTGTLIALSTRQQRSNVDLYNVLGDTVGDSKPSTHHAYDPDFYLRDSEGGFIVFLVENTLFKVKNTYLVSDGHSQTCRFIGV